METFFIILVIFIALEHFVFLYLEMFLWTKKLGRKIFSMTIDEANHTKVLAANQGLYNGFLGTGLLWGLFYLNKDMGSDIILFFLICILIAGIYGGITAKRSILYIQALPALLTIVLLVTL